VVVLGSPLAMGFGQIPSSVAFAALYSCEDAVVRYPASVARDSGAQSIEVPGSHTGLVFNRRVYARLADLLAGPGNPPAAVRF
jgi:hypothetical protein